MSLEAHVEVESRGVNATVAVEPGATLALLGPNGSGKSTVLAAIAGTLAHAGTVTLDGATLTRTTGRRIGLVTQHADLFPAMTVLDNVAYGIRAGGASRADARAQAREWLARVGIADLAHRRPAQLSGGQARRATVARALAARPVALMLDEPFAGVDVEAAQSLRALVQEACANVTTVIATHEVLDAHLLADRVAVMEAGRVTEAGAVDEVLERPRTAFAAAMAGKVWLRGRVHAGALVLDDGTRLAVGDSSVARGPAAVALRPVDVTVAQPRERADIADVVVGIEPRGDLVRVTGAVIAADVAPERAAGMRVGDPLRVSVPSRAMAYALGEPAQPPANGGSTSTVPSPTG